MGSGATRNAPGIGGGSRRGPAQRAAALLTLALAAGCSTWPRSGEEIRPTRNSATPGANGGAGLGGANPAFDGLAHGSLLLGSPVVDGEGMQVGTVEDVLIAPRNGEIVGLVLVLRGPEGQEQRRVVPHAALDWQGQPGSELVLETSSEEALDTKLFADGQRTTVAGKITGIDEADSPAVDSLVLKILDADNLLHRVRVEPAHLAARGPAALEVGRALTAEGVLTRDGTGKLLIASALATNEGKRLELRDPAGTILWGPLAARFRSAASLPDLAIQVGEGEGIPVRGWLVDWPGGTVPYLCVEVDGVERALTWEAVERDAATGTWRFERNRAVLGSLPALQAGGDSL